MGFRKFGTGEVLGADQEDPQGISKEAVAGQVPLWTDKDTGELADENQEADNSGRQLPPTP
jgi:hypothetical protein